MFRTLLATTTLTLMLVALFSGPAPVYAQCFGCGTAVPQVAYQPVTAMPQVAFRPVTAVQPVAFQTFRPYTGWYPGYLLDRMRGVFRPRVVAGFAPTYTAAFAPAVHTVARPVAMTAFQPVSSCSTCFSNPCGCTVQRVVMRPVTWAEPTM